MAYSTSAPPVLVSCGPLTGSGQVWYHSSADATAAFDASGFITNGGALGMRVGDIVIHRDTTSTTTATTSHQVVTVSTTYPGAVDLSDGVVIGSATSSD